MTHRLQNFFMVALFALMSLFWAQTSTTSNSVFENSTLGGYQLFEASDSEFFADNPLNALEKIFASPDIAPDCCNAPKGGAHDFTATGSGNNLIRKTTLDGQTVTIKSGHAYNRPHAGGDVSRIGTMDEIEGAILNDISTNSRLGSLAPATTQKHTVQVNGQSIEYTLAHTPIGPSISSYYPPIP